MIGAPKTRRDADDPVQVAALRTLPGQASWAGIGAPKSATCGRCLEWGANRARRPDKDDLCRCRVYTALLPDAQRQTIPFDAPACRHFTPINRPWRNAKERGL